MLAVAAGRTPVRSAAAAAVRRDADDDDDDVIADNERKQKTAGLKAADDSLIGDKQPEVCRQI